jgi:hypothetical protein
MFAEYGFRKVFVEDILKITSADFFFYFALMCQRHFDKVYKIVKRTPTVNIDTGTYLFIDFQNNSQYHSIKIKTIRCDNNEK